MWPRKAVESSVDILTKDPIRYKFGIYEYHLLHLENHDKADLQTFANLNLKYLQRIRIFESYSRYLILKISPQ